ncbi:MAG TPA: SDR family NAD(P)-dependent oxidoreductase [Caulobacteraceae bacterium]|nr:SDR family NAD(P)-dependent oxidoreductase [Caulobacteraceae bacterium]
MKDLAGKVAFVTGAASGIGFGIATALAQAGVKVMLCDVEAPALAAAVERLKATNADVDGVVADVSLKAELQKAADATIARFGKVNILVNNAGVGAGGVYPQWDMAGYDWTMAVNLTAVRDGIAIFGPLIEANGESGHIVSTASIAGLLSGSATAYNVSKYGVVALSEGLRPYMAAKGIGVSVLCPGLINTRILDGERNRPERFEAAERRTLTPAEQAGLDAFRASLAAGIDPLYVGELVREAIEEDWPYIFTDNQFEPMIDARFAAIKAGFDRIRARTPRKG